MSLWLVSGGMYLYRVLEKSQMCFFTWYFPAKEVLLSLRRKERLSLVHYRVIFWALSFHQPCFGFCRCNFFFSDMDPFKFGIGCKYFISGYVPRSTNNLWQSIVVPPIYYGSLWSHGLLKWKLISFLCSIATCG